MSNKKPLVTLQHKRTLIGGIIGIIIIAATAWVNGCFSTKPPPVTNIESKDSSTLINQSNNTQSGDINTEIIKGDKIEKQEIHVEAPKSIPRYKPEISTERKLNKQDIARIKKNIPLDFSIGIMYQSGQSEVYNYAYEILNHLQAEGYNVRIGHAIVLGGDDKAPRFSLAVNKDAKTADLWIMPLPK